MVWLHGEASLLRFLDHTNSLHPTIQFTMEYGQSVHFLDALLALERNGCISSDLYVKPTDSHQYLLSSSNHPPHVHVHLPYGLALRIRQMVSSDERLRRQAPRVEVLPPRKRLQWTWCRPAVCEGSVSAAACGLAGEEEGVWGPSPVGLRVERAFAEPWWPHSAVPAGFAKRREFIDLFQRSPVVELPQTTEPPWPAGTQDMQECWSPSSFCGQLVQVRACSVRDLRDNRQPNRIDLKSESRPIHGHFICETGPSSTWSPAWVATPSTLVKPGKNLGRDWMGTEPIFEIAMTHRSASTSVSLATNCESRVQS